MGVMVYIPTLGTLNSGNDGIFLTMVMPLNPSPKP